MTSSNSAGLLVWGAFLRVLQGLCCISASDWETKDCILSVSIGRSKRIYQRNHFLSLVFKYEMRTGEAEIGHRSQQVLELEFGFKSTDQQCGLFPLP